MSSKLITLLVLALAINPTRADIDFTPVVHEYKAEGFTYRQLRFKKDEGTVTLSPPQQWAVRGGKDRVQLSPPNKHLVEATIQAVPLAAPQRFDEAAMKAFEEQIIRGAPPGSESVQLIKREENPVVIGQNLSFGLVISYQLLGQTFQRSMIFVNCPDQQLIFRFSAPKADFETFNSDFRRSLSSWQTSEPAPSAANKSEPKVASNQLLPVSVR